MKKMITNFRFTVSVTLFIMSIFFVSQAAVVAAEKNRKNEGYLGVSVEELTRSLERELKAEFGVVITHISLDSPADKYGLMEDDVIQYVDNIKMRRPSTLTRIIRKIEPETKVKIQVIRDGSKKTLDVKIGKRKNWENMIISGNRGGNLFKFYSRGNGYLGVQLFELNKDLAPYFDVKADEGVLILDVEEDSPAEKADLKSGDVIVKVDEEDVYSPDEVKEIISEFEEDDTVELEIVRNRKTKKIKVTLGEREDVGNIFISPHRNMKRIKIDPLHNMFHKKNRELKIESDDKETKVKIYKKKSRILEEVI